MNFPFCLAVTATDMRRPYPVSLGVYLNFGKLDSAEPCPLLDCGSPAMEYFVQVSVPSIEYTDEFSDPATEAFKAAGNIIAEMVH